MCCTNNLPPPTQQPHRDHIIKNSPARLFATNQQKAKSQESTATITTQVSCEGEIEKGLERFENTMQARA